MSLKYKKINDLATEPTRGSQYSAGLDLYAAIESNIEVPAHSMVKIGTGLSFELPAGTFGAIYPRSGLATKQGLRLANGTGIMDADYRGEYIVALFNDSNETRIIEPKERIAQLVIQPCIIEELEQVEELTETQRGTGGFGSTGTK